MNHHPLAMFLWCFVGLVQVDQPPQVVWICKALGYRDDLKNRLSRSNICQHWLNELRLGRTVDRINTKAKQTCFSLCCVFASRKLQIQSCLLFQSEFSMQEESEKAKLTCQDCDGESRGVLFVALWWWKRFNNDTIPTIPVKNEIGVRPTNKISKNAGGSVHSTS